MSGLIRQNVQLELVALAKLHLCTCMYRTDHMQGNKFTRVARGVMNNQHACDEAGTCGKLACVATRGCWCNSKVIHCTNKYWGINTTTGRYEHARQFFSAAMPSICPVLLLPLFYFTL